MAASFDYPSAVLVDKDGNVMPVWDQWFSRVQSIASSVQQSGITANRPDKMLWIGRSYYDTTLGKPVWVHSVRPTVWHDASGAVV